VSGGEEEVFAVRYVELKAGPWRLRTAEPKDAPAALAMLTDDEVTRWNPANDVVDLDSARSWLARSADWSSGGHRTWCVVDAEDTMVGNVSLWALDAEHRSAGVGYRVMPDRRRQGVASQSVQAVSRWAISDLGVERIALEHVIANPGSCGVAQRAGYLLEGTLRQDYRLPDGSRWDSHLHSLLPSDLG